MRGKSPTELGRRSLRALKSAAPLKPLRRDRNVRQSVALRALKSAAPLKRISAYQSCTVSATLRALKSAAPFLEDNGPKPDAGSGDPAYRGPY